MPAVASRSLLDLAESQPGDTLALGTISSSIPIRAIATAGYFPTLNPREEHFIVVDLRTFTHYMNLHSQNLVGGSNELWVDLAGDVQDPSAIAEELRSLGIDPGDFFVAADMVSERVNQPLVSAGWGGLLILMFLALVGISILPILEVAEEGIRVTPPMIMRINWGILLITYLVLAVVAASTVVWLAWITMKLEVQRVLRIGEA